MSVLSDDEIIEIAKKADEDNPCLTPYGVAIRAADDTRNIVLERVVQMIQGMTSSDVFFDTDLCPYTINAITEKIKAKMQE